MSEIQIKELNFAYEGTSDNIFENVSFRMDTDWKLGLIGRNGKGKTTLLKLLQGEYEYKGSIMKSVAVDYFPFEMSTEEKQKNTLEVVYQIDPDCEFWKVCREWNYLKGCEDVWDRPFYTMSNGEQTKMQLAILFAKENNFLLIDEPTNHLDQDAREHVKQYLDRKKGFLLVSHDRDFLDGCVDHIVSLNRNNIEVMQGNFSVWWENKCRQDAYELSQNEKLKKDILRLKHAAKQARTWADNVEDTKIGEKSFRYERCIDTRAYVGEKSKRMQQRRKNLEKRKEKEVEEKGKFLKNIEKEEPLKICPLAHEKEILLEADSLVCRYRDKAVSAPICFKLKQGDVMILDGKNGSGKSTIIKKILGEEIESEGILRRASHLKISYVPQDTGGLMGSIEVFCHERNIDKTLFFQYLRKFDLAREQFNKNLEQLSEGQKKKVLLAASLCENANVYIWDEPLNYVDIYTRIQLEELIQKFHPTMILVDHDKVFAEHVATQIYSLQSRSEKSIIG